MTGTGVAVLVYLAMTALRNVKRRVKGFLRVAHSR
jgi:hypothetical protein